MKQMRRGKCKVCGVVGKVYDQEHPNFDGWCKTCYVRYRFLVRALESIGARPGNSQRLLQDLITIDAATWSEATAEEFGTGWTKKAYRNFLEILD